MSGQVKIIGNADGELSEEVIGCTGSIIGQTDDGQYIVDFFNEKDGNFHMAALSEEDIEFE